MDAKISQIKVDSLDYAQPLGRFLILLFNEFERELLESLHRIKEFSGISFSDLQILRYIKPSGSTVIEIARLCGISKQAVSRSVASLHKRGFVVKESHSSDGRAYLVTFSPKGLRLLTEAIRIISNIERRYQNLIGSKELARIKAGLKKLFESYQ